MKLIVFTVLIVAAAAAEFDSSRCAHGPEYWCQHQDTAAQCGAIQYCQDNVWPKVTLTANDVCTDCKNFLGDVQALLENSTVQNMIVNDIKMLCADLGPYADQCSSLVDQYGSLVLGLLASELDPSSVCGVIGFCSGNYFKAGNNMCSDCEAFFGDVQGLLKNTTVQQQIDNLIMTTCHELGFKASDCSLILAVAPQIFDFLASELDPKMVCNAIQFCQSSLLSRYNSVQFKAADQCADCKAFFGDVETMLQNKTVQNEIVQDLLAVCNYAGTYKEECKLALQSFLPGVLTQMASYLDPSIACPAIGFCPSTEPKKEVDELKTNELISVNADVCTDCKNFFGDVKIVLMNATNQDTIVNALKTVCADLGSFADQCTSYVDQYGKIVISLLASSLDSATICNDFGFCSSQSGKLKLTGDMCTDCVAFIGDVQTLLENTTVQTMIMNDLKSICSLFGSEADQCKNYIDTYGPIVFSLLASEIDPKTVCTTIQFCPGALVNTINLLQSSGSDLCTTCKSVASEIDAYLNDPTIQKSIIAAIDIFCSSTGTFAEECKLMVDMFGPKVLEELATLLEPNTFCSEFDFCSSQKKMVSMSTLTLATPIHKMIAKTNIIPAMEMSQAKQTNQVTDSTVCSVCKLVIEQLDKYLADNSTEAEIKAAVEKVCNDLPSSFKTECNALVSQYGSAIIQLLIQKIEPTKICTELSLCTSKEELKLSASTECTLCEFVMTELDSLISDNATDQEILNALEKVCSLLPTSIQDDCNQFVNTYTPEILKMLQQLTPDQVCAAIGLCSQKAKKNVEESAECVLCEFVMKELESLLTENSTEQEILNALEKVCSLLPTTLQDDCKNMINTYGPEIFELLKTMSPDEICTAINLCGPSEQLKVSASGGCILCEFVMKELDAYLSENATEDEIIKGLDKVCSLLPSTISADCVAFINTYGDTILKLLLAEIDPVNVCKALTLCTDTDKQFKVTSEETCDLCKVVVMSGDEYLEKNSTIQEVTKVLESVCDVLGANYRTTCHSLVQQYGAVIPELLAQLLDPTKVCQELSLCQVSKKMLGENECTYGPSYWCASMENAQKCNAVVHCKNHVWN